MAAKLKLVEEITFGENDDPDKSFSDVGIFAVDSRGAIYVADTKDQKIKVFDSDGKFLRLIGKKGQGPGELSMPGGVQITLDNELIIEDALNRKLAFFTLEGEFIRTISLTDKMGFGGGYLDFEGNYIVREISLADNKMFTEVKKYDADFKALFTLDKVSASIPLSGNKMNPFDLMIVYQFDKKGNIFYGRNQGDYEIKVFSPEGKHVRSIRKEYQPVKVTEKDIEEMLARIPSMGGPNIRDFLEFSKNFPPFQSFTLDEQGRLFVRTWEKGRTEGEYVNDIFDAEGRFISQCTTKAEFRVWKNHKVYAVEESDEGLKVIKKYEISWEK